jgi:hypothetical protein
VDTTYELYFGDVNGDREIDAGRPYAMCSTPIVIPVGMEIEEYSGSRGIKEKR